MGFYTLLGQMSPLTSHEKLPVAKLLDIKFLYKLIFR